MDDKELLHAKIAQGFKLSIGKVISDSFELFGKGAGYYIGFIIISFFTVLAAIFIGAVSFLLFIPIIVVIAFYVAPGLQVGLARFTKSLQEGKKLSFSLFLSGFKHNVGNLIFQAIVITSITLLLNYGLQPEYYQDVIHIMQSFDGEDFDGYLQDLIALNELHNQTTILRVLSSLFSFYISLGLSLTPFIVSFYNVSAFTAIDASFRTINKVVLQAGLAKFALTILLLLGLFVFFVGVLATLPIYLIGSYLIFKYTIGEKDAGNQDEWSVNQHLVDRN